MLGVARSLQNDAKDYYSEADHIEHAHLMAIGLKGLTKATRLVNILNAKLLLANAST
jgi:hypothetical protein